MLVDGFGREFTYLRLSVTDACNFRCSYCLPNGYSRPKDWQAPLNVDEIERLVRGFALLGVRKVRLTGGEPTTRRDIGEIVARVAGVPGIETVALTTNGYRLRHLASDLAVAGLKQVNVSIDTLDPKNFLAITGQDALADVLLGVDAALCAGLRIKTNAVLLQDCNDTELERFLQWVTDRPITVRFIELMRTADNDVFFLRRHSALAALEERLLAAGFVRRARGETDGPAVEFSHAQKRGSVGLIAPYSKGFCTTCNRLRVTSSGGLRLCLFGEGNLSLRPLLQQDFDPQRIAEAVRSALSNKSAGHRLSENVVGNTVNLSQMGG